MDITTGDIESYRRQQGVSHAELTAAQLEVCPAGAARARGPDVSARGVGQ